MIQAEQEQPADIVEALGDLDQATAVLLTTITGLSDTSARGRSRLPGWSRGHVLAHLARNAEGSVRLPGWVRAAHPGRHIVSYAAVAAS